MSDMHVLGAEDSIKGRYGGCTTKAYLTAGSGVTHTWSRHRGSYCWCHRRGRSACSSTAVRAFKVDGSPAGQDRHDAEVRAADQARVGQG